MGPTTSFEGRSVSVVLAFGCFAFTGVAAEVRWDVPISGRDIWYMFDEWDAEIVMECGKGLQ